MKIIFLDTETTGFGECRLVEIAWHTPGARYIREVRVRPPIPIEDKAAEVHGITNEMVKDLPEFKDHINYSFLKDLLENNLIVMHNAQFDIGVLAREGITIETYICTQRVAKKIWPGSKSHGLQKLREYLGIQVAAQAHSAVGDVAVLAALFEEIRKDLMQEGESEEDFLARAAQFTLA